MLGPVGVGRGRGDLPSVLGLLLLSLSLSWWLLLLLLVVVTGIASASSGCVRVGVEVGIGSRPSGEGKPGRWIPREHGCAIVREVSVGSSWRRATRALSSRRLARSCKGAREGSSRTNALKGRSYRSESSMLCVGACGQARRGESLRSESRRRLNERERERGAEQSQSARMRFSCLSIARAQTRTRQ